MPGSPRRSPRLPLFAAAIFRTLVPTAEREEVLEDLRTEFGRRLDEHGRAAARKWFVTLLTLLAGLALLLGAVGVYGVMTHYVTRRSRDYGICIALGQLPSGVVRQVVGRGAALVAVGGTIGIMAAIAATKVLSTLLFGVTATDPVSLASAIVVLLAVGILAAFVPARRASLTDPAVILRQ